MAAIAHLLDEVVLTGSSAEGPVQAWDVRTGMQLKAYKYVLLRMDWCMTPFLSSCVGLFFFFFFFLCPSVFCLFLFFFFTPPREPNPRRARERETLSELTHPSAHLLGGVRSYVQNVGVRPRGTVSAWRRLPR